MRKRQKRIYLHGLLWGAISFLSGVAIAFVTLPDQLKIEGIDTWKMATWVWINAHGILISESSVTGSIFDTGSLDLVSNIPEIQMLTILPILLAVFPGLLISNSLGPARNDKTIIEYTVAGAGGYVVIGLLSVVLTGARSGVGLIVVLIGVLALSAYVGARLANSLPIPIFAITSISGLVGIGLVFLIGAGIILTVAIPFLKYAFAGLVISTISLWISKNTDF